MRSSLARLSTAEARLSLALDSTSIGVWDWDMVSGDVWMSDSALAVQGFARGELHTTALGVESYAHADDYVRWKRQIIRCLKGELDLISDEHRMRHKNGKWVWVMEWARVVERDADGRAIRMIGTRADMTARRKSEERMRWLAVHDPLTSLPNRGLFDDMLNAAILRCDEDGGAAGLLFIDIDNFKRINDRDGHDAGDRALCMLADRLRGLFESPATVARIGGDEFGVVLPDIEPESLMKLAERAILPSDTGGVPVSVGAALYPHHAKTARALRRAADAALYRAKSAGRGVAIIFED
ncbi:diguanylate cyclase [Pacificimonas sp. WHA3]|uniref:Diguanylate cyclase n=1 Tax=Pacificimonas pallii TaxID=2827236 RepID=A0ABS6SC96_9SPHN|nr:diguanylate cyclase [Pacificimonas pallii]MBV7255482.1 diguanylate cyclase [Pacificimonas pallii]